MTSSHRSISISDTDLLNPEWETLGFFEFCRNSEAAITLPPFFSDLVSNLFFPDGRHKHLDVSEKSHFKYAQELRDLLPKECVKGHLTFADVENAFLCLALSYANRTERLQRAGNRMLRGFLAHQVFGVKALPQHLFASSASDEQAVLLFARHGCEELMLEQDIIESPGEGVLLRTATTSPEVLAQPPCPHVVTWEDQTTQLCHYLLHQLFHLPDVLAPGITVVLLNMKSAWLDGAEGTLGDLDLATGRWWVHVLRPQSAVNQAIALHNRPMVQILPSNLMRWPGDTDRVSLRKLQDDAVGRPEKQALLQKFLPFISLFTGGNVDTEISMAVFVARIKRACNLFCWNDEVFIQPVHSYLSRKLRHVMDKVELRHVMDKVARAPTSSASILLVTGTDYYASFAETNADGDRIYFPAKLIAFKLLPGNMVQMLLETFDKSGQPQRIIVQYLTGPMMPTLFVPKEEFEEKPLGVIVLPEASQAATGPSDWSTYDSDMNKILSSIALRCPQFTMSPGMLPDNGKESTFTIGNGGSPSLNFVEIDHGLSFKPFFGDKTSACNEQEREALLRTSAMCETNRCLFIHLGVALGLHPIAVQAIFRDYSDVLLTRIGLALSQKTSEDDQRLDAVTLMVESLQSVLKHNDLIDAPVLSALWPQELQKVRILIFSVGHSGPQPNLCYLFSPCVPTDSADSFNGTDVILKLQGMHFTLLRLRIEDASSSPIDQILDMFPDIVPIQPLHLQDGDAAALVKEVGPVRSVADLHRDHSCASAPAPAHLSASAAAPASASAAAPAHLNANVGEPEPYD